MTMFRLFLATFLLILLGYTAVVIAEHGLDLLPVFFGDMAQMTWPGQFNLDFFGFLLLSALWVAWRHQFSPSGLALTVLAALGGMGSLCIYLLAISAQTSGDIKEMLLGPRRA